MTHHATNSRNAILDAAEDIVVELGARHLTLDQVAKRAGISRGGFLYHFSGKEALLLGMLERRHAQFHCMLEKHKADLPDTPEGEVKALVRAFLEGGVREKRIASSIVAAAAHDPGLLTPTRKELRGLIDRLCSQGVPRDRAGVIVMALQGLMITDLLSIAQIDIDERKGIIREIISLTKDKTTG